MLANPLYFFALVLAAGVGVSAQTADACILSCVQAGLANSTCTSFTDLSCVCKSTSFQATAKNCLVANCTTADQQAALQLQQEECGSANTTSSSSASSASASSTSKSSSATAPIEQLPFLTAFIGFMGVALGGAFAL